ncbi:MAG TPA: hypothetical protein PLJ25_02840 [Methanothrix sp.]|nr:hypothetical protein [Methanothrix sp.]
MTEQNRRYVQKEIGRLLSEIWRIKGLAEQEYSPCSSPPALAHGVWASDRQDYETRIP